MVIFKLIGRTAPLDWSSSAKDVELGLFRTEHAAQTEKEWREADPDFHMDWYSLRIEEATLIG